MGKRYEFENQTTGILRIPVFKRTASTRKPGATRKVRDRSASIVIGSSKDRSLPPGVERGPRCPSPLVVLTEEQIAALEPRARAFLDSCVAQGWLRQREIAA